MSLQEEDFQHVEITTPMIQYCNKIKDRLDMNRTKESSIDTEVGIMGELVFAQWMYGDYMRGNTLSEIRDNFGQVDFDGRYEIKASAHKFSWKLHLPVRQDYAEKRKPLYYIQVLFDTDKPVISVYTNAMIIGYCSSAMALDREPETMGRVTSFKCYLTPFSDLLPMSDFRELEGGYNG